MNRLLHLLLAPVVALLTVPVLLASAAPAHACDCAPPDPTVAWGDQVFVATMTEGLPDDASGDVEVDAVVTHVYRGSVPDRVRVQTYAGETSCGRIDLDAGQARLFSVDDDEAADGVVVVGYCGGSPVVDDEVVAEVEADLGPGERRDVPEPALAPADDGEGRSVLPVVAVGLAALGSVLGVVAFVWSGPGLGPR